MAFRRQLTRSVSLPAPVAVPHRGLNRTARALLWMAASGALYSLLNALLRSMSLGMSPFQTLTLAYGSTLPLMLPLVLRAGPRRFLPRDTKGLLVRGTVHWLGMCLWLVAVTGITLAETTAICFTTPLFVMGGAVTLLKEPFRWPRAVATLVGFAGLIVILVPRLGGTGSGSHALLMLAAAGVFAASFLLSKRLTRSERPSVIVVWQSLIVTILSIPLAVFTWQRPSMTALVTALGCGVLTTVGNYCLTRAFTEADISASQPAKFLDLIWACLLGWLFFGDVPETTTLVGGIIILTSTVWVAHREGRSTYAP
jgi:drug/metabolite transporter (DMT)-like permease